MHAVHAQHVCDLVRIGDDGGRTEGEDEPRELVDHQLHRLEVHVRVDEPGDDVLPARVEHIPALVVAETGDDSVHDRDVDLEPLFREDGEHPTSADDEIGRFVPAGNGEPSAQLLHARSVIP